MAGLRVSELGYLILSCLFFSASAWAQLNDPDPAVWVALYLAGGCGLNLLVWAASRQDKAAAEAWSKAGRDCAVYYGTLVTVFMWNTGTALSERLDKSELSSLQLSQWCWKILEHEEGREMAGLILLLAHTATIGCYMENQLSQNSNVTAFVTTALLVCTGLLVLGGVYMWVQHQPALNAVYKQAHCDGMMPLTPVLPGTEEGAQENEAPST